MGVRSGSTTSTCEACEATEYSDTTSGQCKKKTPCEEGNNRREVIPAQTIMPAMCCDDSDVTCKLTNMTTYVGAATHGVNQFNITASARLVNLSASLDDIVASSSDASWW